MLARFLAPVLERIRRRRVRVLYVLPRLTVGGMERVCEQLCARFDPARFEVRVLVTEERTRPRTITSERLAAAGIRVDLLTEPNWETRIHQVGRVILEWGTDIVLNNFCVCTKEAIAWLAQHGNQPRVIEAIHGVDPKQPLHTWLFQYDALVSVSAETTDTLLAYGFPDEEIDTIENGVDVATYRREPRPELRAELGLTPDDFVLGMNCRLTWQKAPDLVFQALAGLRGRHPNLRLLSAGPGFRDIKPEDPDYRAMAESLGVLDMVRFLGPRSDVPELLAITDCYLSASRWEGMSISMLEAMAAGRPMVATPTEGTSRLVEDGLTGIVTGGFTADDIAAGIEAMLALSPHERASLGANAQRRADAQFSLRRTVESYEALFERVMTLPPRPWVPERRFEADRLLEVRRREAEAAEGSAGKPPLLVISHDAEPAERIITAGGLRLLCMLRVLAEEHEVHLLLWNPGIWAYPPEKVQGLEAEGIRVLGAVSSAAAALDRITHSRAAYRRVIFQYTRATAILPEVKSLLPGVPVVVDTHDVEGEKARQAAALSDLAAVNEGYVSDGKEAERQLEACAAADLVVAISERDRTLLVEAGVSQDIVVVPLLFPERDETPAGPGDPRHGNGVPPEACQPPRRPILFVGNSYYVPNVDAVLWFLRHCLGPIREHFPDAHLVWVGELNDEMKAGVFPPELDRPDVSVVGWAPSLTPYYQHSALMVCPLRVGSGQKGKVAGALRGGLPVVSTQVGISGMSLTAGEDLLVADAPEAFVEAVCDLLAAPDLGRTLANNARSKAGAFDVGHHREAILAIAR